MNDLPRLKIGFDIENKMAAFITERYTGTVVMGKSGTGKSITMENWIEQDGYYGNAMAVVDASGFLARDVYGILRGKAIYCSLDHDVSINPMIAPYSPDQISSIVCEQINQVIKITTEDSVKSLTPNMRDILVEQIKWCLANSRPSLLHVLDRVKNLHGNIETRSGIISRMELILSDERMVKILCGRKSIEWSELIDKRQRLILDCHGMNREQTIMSGCCITMGVKNYFRFSKPKEYKPISVFIDEFQLFTNSSMLDILKEGRKYKLSLIMASQDMAVIDEKLSRVMLNSGNLVVYRLGYREASMLSKELDMMPQDLQYIEKYHVAYLTQKQKGIAKAPRPPFFIPREPKKVEPQFKSRPRWFPLASYQPA